MSPKRVTVKQALNTNAIMTIPVPNITPLYKILPEEPLLMMGAGPVPISNSVAKANSIVINHLGSTMSEIIEQVKSMSRYVFQTKSEWMLGVAGPGSAAMEMAVSNLVWPEVKVLCICNGLFSSRLALMASRVGGEVIRYNIDDQSAADPEKVKAYLEKYRPDIITIVQGETSHTIFNRYLPDICNLARAYGCYIIVDAVCTLSTIPLKMDDWHIDAVITGGQKGLSSIPGVSLIAFSERAWKRIKNRQHDMTHWCLDAQLAAKFWHEGSYHYTAPVSGILAIHEALRLVCEETLPVRFMRHERCSLAMQAGIEAMGLSLYIPVVARLNSVIGISLPKNINPQDICNHISKHHRVEIAGSFGPNIVRIGQMGEQCREHNLFRTLHAFGSTMKDFGLGVDIPSGMAALEECL